MDPEIDILNASAGGFQAQGSLAAALLNSAGENAININSFRSNTVLRKDEWKEFDTQVVEIARENLVMTGFLMQRGLTRSMPNAMGTTVLEWEKISDMEGAELNMNGLSRTDNDGVSYQTESMPIPIIHKDFSLNARQLYVSRKLGTGLDTTQVTIATRKVAERIEDLIFNGAKLAATNGNIYGLRTHPNRVAGSLTVSWATASGEQMVSDVLRMIDALVAKNQRGPFLLLVNTSVDTRMGNDYKANSDKTIRSRIAEIPGIAGIMASSRVPIGEVMLVQLSQETIQMIDGIQPTVIAWNSHGGMQLHFKVLAIMLPRIRADFLSQSGIAQFS